MRLHHLSATAFGPFVDTVDVDFDTLSDAGLFLLSGPTGAGKSSVLDAVCFALYGAVPGDRNHAGLLRCDLAPPDLAPAVTLEVGLSGRRFRIVRSPAWERPKRRGTGTTREQARVTVSERLADGWTPLTSRLDEAGDLLSGLLGMNLDQFCQVALLPQGRFQAFLRADSASRHQLLSRLFHTGRFERVEAWLRDHRLTLHRESEQHAHVVADLVSRLSEAAEMPSPEPLTDLDAGSPSAWAATVHDDAQTRRRAAADALVAAVESEGRAHAEWQRALALATARTRVVEAAGVVTRLEADAPARAAERDRLGRARLADGLRPLVRLADDHRSRLDELAAESAASLAEVERAELDPSDLSGELERTGDALARLVALRPSEEHLTALDRRREAAAVALAGLDDDERLAAAEAEAVSSVLAEAEHVTAETVVTAEALAAAERAVETARALADAHNRLVRLLPEHEALSGEHTAAVRRVLDARQHELDLRERRIAGMAGELAGALAAGDDCPVCGSVDHPRPAALVSGHPDAADERAATRAVVDAQALEHATGVRLRELDAAVATARELVGATQPQDAVRLRDEARAALGALRDRADRHAHHAERLTAARARAAELEQAAAARRVRRAELDTELRHLDAEAERLSAAVLEARGVHPALDAAVAELEVRRDLLRTARARADGRAAASSALDDAEAALRRAALEAGFDDVATARASQLLPSELAELDTRVREHDASLAAAREVLAEPGASLLLTSPEPDVAGAEALAVAGREQLERCRAADDHAARVLDRVRRLEGSLREALLAWAPVRRQLALATHVASFAEGKAPDNRLQMRLSAYVLAHRLSQVVAAANARLAGISDRRYTLEHVAERSAGERRGGLSLAIRDDWSGEARDPATLSGGETFVVSLALALGLADVVAHEAGGTDLQTLFVDEGFGALDAETLDDVLDVLDTLRENGRAVGVVSHVAEMRDRIPAQLVVAKAPSGSTLRVVG